MVAQAKRFRHCVPRGLPDLRTPRDRKGHGDDTRRDDRTDRETHELVGEPARAEDETRRSPDHGARNEDREQPSGWPPGHATEDEATGHEDGCRRGPSRRGIGESRKMHRPQTVVGAWPRDHLARELRQREREDDRDGRYQRDGPSAGGPPDPDADEDADHQDGDRPGREASAARPGHDHTHSVGCEPSRRGGVHGLREACAVGRCELDAAQPQHAEERRKDRDRHREAKQAGAPARRRRRVDLPRCLDHSLVRVEHAGHRQHGRYGLVRET